jgi:trimeric autotransporter adhesin
MTILVGGTKRVDFDQIGTFAFIGGTTTLATGTVYRVSDGSSFNELTGTFTYDSAGVLTGGTITGWKRVIDGSVAFTATELSVPVTEFLNYLATLDHTALFNAVLGGDDKISGSAFNDELFGAGNDTMAGGAGGDDYTVTEAGDQVIEKASQGIDTVSCAVDGYVLAENVENLYLLDGVSKGTGNSLGNEILAVGSGSNLLDGALGDDTLDGGAGADTLIGGAGNDTYIVSSLADTVTENENEGTDTIRAGAALVDFSLEGLPFAHIENLQLEGKAGFDSVGKGNALNNVISGHSGVTFLLHGLDGNDTLLGNIHNDILDGGTGADLMAGGQGGDIYAVDDAKDKVVELAGPSGGYDIVNAQVSHVLAANVEELNLQDSAVSGTGNALGNWIQGNAGGNKLSGLAGDDEIQGGNGGDTLNGGAGDDELYGEGGDDSLLGEAGDDGLSGGNGNDTLIGGAGNDAYDDVGLDDTIVELAGQGIDLIRTELSEFTLDTKALANVENLNFGDGPAKGTGNNLNNYIEGTASNDTLDGGLGNDTLDGLGGDDLMFGGKGSDSFYVDSAANVVVEQGKDSGIDTVYSTAASLDLSGYATIGVENLVLLVGGSDGTGNALANVIKGNDGNNKLDGGLGDDTLIGGKGYDTYVVDSAKDKIVELTDLPAVYDQVEATVSYVLSANIEDLYLMGGGDIDGTGNSGNNNIFGNAGGNKILGLGGADIVNGKEGKDTLDGGAGTDILSGGAGDDLILGGAGEDDINDGAGNDTVKGGAGSDRYTLEDSGTVLFEAAGQGIDLVILSYEDPNFILPSNVENLDLLDLPGGKGTIVGTGNSADNVIRGNSLANKLTGLLGNDTLDGLGGVDTMVGGKGNDFYFIDSVSDVVTEEENEGTDTVIVELAGPADMSVNLFNVENMIFAGGTAVGNSLDNRITGNALFNVISGGIGNDTLDGAANDDELAGGEGNDSLLGGDGHDILAGGAGNDTMVGGKGNDEYIVDGAGDKVVETAGTDGGFDLVIVTGVTSYTLSASVERLELGGGAANGTGNGQSNGIEGNNLNNKLSGMAGNDTLDGALGADTMAGGAGNDIYSVDSADDKVVEAAGQGIDTIDSSLTNYSLDTKALANVENLNLGGNAGVGVGNSLNNYIRGWNQSDTLIGGAGNDTLDGYVGADSMIGGKGDDTYYVNKSGDTITELAGEGKDTIVTSIDLSLAAGAFVNIENVKIDDNAGAATIDGNALNNLVLGNTSANKISGAAGGDTLHGGSDNDTLNGEDGNDSLIGDDGNDSLNGGIGVDTMIGGAGDDIYIVDSAKEKITELAGIGSGYDIVHTTVDYVLSANVEDLYLEGSATNGTGNAQDNHLQGNDNANKLLGMAGNDSLYSGLGDDTLDGGAGNDTLNGSEGADSLLGGAGDDTLSGDLGVDTMAGGAGNDTYYVLESDDKVSEAAGQGVDSVIVADDFTYSLTPNLENAEAWSGADITGNDLANVIDGIGNDSGDNLLSGLGGNDTLGGGAGLDTLTGGAGRDHFVFTNIDAAVDRVTDFDAGPLGDVLDLSELLTGYIDGTSNASEFVKFVEAGGDTTVQVDFDGAVNGINFVDVCLLQDVSLSNSNQAVMEGNLILASLE